MSTSVGLQLSPKVKAGLVAGGVSVVLVMAARARVRSAARRAAGASGEYHLAVFVPPGAGSACSPSGWVLVKYPKGGDMEGLTNAVAEAVGVAPSRLRLFTITRTDEKASVGPALNDFGGIVGLQTVLEKVPPSRLQVVELVCALDGAAPADEVPAPVPAYQIPGAALPLLGHALLFKGPYVIASHNLAANVFPPDKPYPYGATVRFSNGRDANIFDFPEGSSFHAEAKRYQLMTADPKVVAEIVGRIPEFPKMWNRAVQKNIQDFTGNGLFTSNETGDDWKTAHAILPRGFNQIKVKGFAPMILRKTRTFIHEWSTFSAGHCVTDVNHWLTAMTADAVVSCSMGMDMQSIEKMGADEPAHPFIQAFRFGLGYKFSKVLTPYTEYGLKAYLPGFGATRRLDKRYAECKATLRELVEGMVESTRADDSSSNSVIRSMLQDKASNGKYVRYDAVYGHVINLMIAGHETTAATLGFTMQFLAENPQCEAKALEEVHRVLQGRTEPTADDVPKLQYIEQCFREALRLYSPVTFINRDAAQDTVIQGHRIFQGQRVNIVTRGLHTNPEYWGGEFGDPLSFNPDRFAPEAVKKRHPNAYHPWGFGTRACIGSQFALFEAKTFLASMLLHFKWCAVPGYKLRASLAAGGAAPSPDNLSLIIYPRPGGPLHGDGGVMLPYMPTDDLEPAGQKASGRTLSSKSTSPGGAGAGAQMQVIFGSNAGASEEFANQVATAAKKRGFAVTLSSMDAAAGDAGKALAPDGRIVVVVTSTYNGLPPDNAGKFKTWLTSQKDASLAGVKFAVFGLGNSQWQTYQQFPREVDVGLKRCGAQSVHPIGACDVDGASFESDFDDWLAQFLNAVSGGQAGAAEETAEDELPEFCLEAPGTAPARAPPPLATREQVLQGLMENGTAARKAAVAAGAPNINMEHRFYHLEVASPSRELCQDPKARSVRHVTLRLPANAPPYRAGDHLEVLPANPHSLVAATCDFLGIKPDAPVSWEPKVGRPRIRAVDGSGEAVRKWMSSMRVEAHLVLMHVPDLAQAPSRKVCAQLVKFAADADAKAELKTLGEDSAAHTEQVVKMNLSLTELLQRYKGRLNLSLTGLCTIAKPLAPRYYSVSSSPAGAKDPRLVAVSVGQVHFTTPTGRNHDGLASTLLGGLGVGSLVPGGVRTLSGHFHLPADITAPIIMVGPGTGVAPMMGFLQEREHLLKSASGKKLGPAVLFFGCRKSDEDYIYKEELQGHLKSGALSDLHVAFSREGPQKVYVQDVIWEKRQAVWAMLQHPNSAIYICGDARSMAPDVKKAFQRVAEDCGGRNSTQASNMIAAMVENARYLEDVWA